VAKTWRLGEGGAAIGGAMRVIAPPLCQTLVEPWGPEEGKARETRTRWLDKKREREKRGKKRRKEGKQARDFRTR